MLLMPLVDRFNAVSCLSSVKRGARESKGEKNSIWAFIKGTQEARGARRQLLAITHEWQDKEQFIKSSERRRGEGKKKKWLKSMSHPFELFSCLRKRYYTEGLYSKTQSLLNSVLLCLFINDIQTSIRFSDCNPDRSEIIRFRHFSRTLQLQ